MLVSSDPAVANDPIIGYNVIKAVVNKDAGRTALEKKELAHKVSKAFSTTVKTAQMVMKLMQHRDAHQDAGVARTGWKRVFLPAKQVTTVQVRAHISSQSQFSVGVCENNILSSPALGESTG